VKHFYRLFFSILLLALAACGPSTPAPASEPEELSTPDQSEEGLRIAITPAGGSAGGIEAAPVEEAYPIPVPTPIIIDEDYPAPPTPLPPSLPGGYEADPAAEGTVWILFPVGEQCAEAAESRYADLTTAVSELTAVGITVYEAEVTDLIVCSACGCPTSAHYRVSIDAAQWEIAKALEWIVEE